MTASLQQAFAEAAKLPDSEQEVLPSWLLAELAVDRAIAASSEKLAALSREALSEQPVTLDPECL